MSAEHVAQLEQQAATLLNNHQLPAALQLYEQVCSADDTNADAWMKLGIIHGMQNNHNKAAECLGKSLALDPGSFDTRMNYAQALLQSGEHAQAIEQYNRATESNPESGTAWFMLGRCLTAQDQTNAALEAYRKALDLKPEYAQALYGLGNSLNCLDRVEEAVGYLRHALRLKPDLAAAHLALGTSLHKLGNLREALDHMQKAVRLNPGNPEFQHGTGLVLTTIGKPDIAVSHLRKAIELKPGYTGAQISLAATLHSLGQPDEAEQLIEAIIEKYPDNIEAITLAANIDQRRGHIDKAHERIRPLLDAGRTHLNLLLAYADICGPLDEAENAINLMEQMLETDSALSTTGRCNLHFALGKLYDSSSRYRLAFEHYRKGNQLKHAEFDPVDHVRGIDTLIRTLSADIIATLPRSSIRSEQPVFVIGMPRSGTTLVEQILSSHPDAFGAGELPYIIQQTSALSASAGYPQCIPTLTQQAITDAARDYLGRISELSANSKRVIDKMPGNFMHLGYIELLFPDARIIHCKRDPLDTCLSNYFQNFSRSQHFSFNLTHLGIFYRNYARLMEHWSNVITLPMIEVQYEDMIANQESGSRRIVEFCGLDWDEQCMDFHKSERYVSTASYDQVRRPIYKSSVARRENYTQFIAPLRKALE